MFFVKTQRDNVKIEPVISYTCTGHDLQFLTMKTFLLVIFMTFLKNNMASSAIPFGSNKLPKFGCHHIMATQQRRVHACMHEATLSFDKCFPPAITLSFYIACKNRLVLILLSSSPSCS